MRSFLRSWLLATLAGVVAGLAAVLVVALLDATQWLVAGESASAQEPATVRQALVVGAAGSVAAFAWVGLRHWQRRRNGPLAEAADALLQTVSVGIGAPVGREQAPRILARLLTRGLLARLRVTESAVTVFAGASMGAAFGAVYNTPLAGVAFAVERVLRGRRLSEVLIAGWATAIAVPIGWLAVPRSPAFAVAPSVAWPDLAWLIVVVPLAFVLGTLVRWVWSRAARVNLGDLAKAAGGLLAFWLMAAAAIVLPQILGNGKAVVAAGLAGELGLWEAVLLTVVKFAAVALFFAVGIRGGQIMPAVAVGMGAGTVLALVVEPLVGAQHASTVGFMLGIAVLAVSQRAPVFALCFGVELVPFSPALAAALLVTVLLVGIGLRAGPTPWKRRWPAAGERPSGG